MKRCFFLFLLLPCLGSFAANSALLFSQENALSWTMAFAREGNEGPQSFSRPITMKDGELFTLIIDVEEPCYCYIVIQDSEQNTAVFHNAQLTPESGLNLGPVELTPPGGTETIYVIISKKAQKGVEGVVKNFSRDQNRRNAAAVMNHIFELRKNISAIKEGPEKPVLMGGAFRGTESEVTGLRYTGAEVYVKSIQIRH